MEEFRPLDQVLTIDPRCWARHFTLEKLHTIASELSLSERVPDEIQDQYMVARYAYLYSSFYYPLQCAAFLYSILAIERALSIRVKQECPSMFAGERVPTLYPLLQYALKQRWILDEGFDLEVPEDLSVSEKIAKAFPEVPKDQRYSYTLLDSLVFLRNELAHGTYVLAPSISPLLRRGAEIINQLFPANGRLTSNADDSS